MVEIVISLILLQLLDMVVKVGVTIQHLLEADMLALAAEMVEMFLHTQALLTQLEAVVQEDIQEMAVLQVALILTTLVQDLAAAVEVAVPAAHLMLRVLEVE
jgi:ferritin-like protein